MSNCKGKFTGNKIWNPLKLKETLQHISLTHYYRFSVNNRCFIEYVVIAEDELQ